MLSHALWSNKVAAQERSLVGREGGCAQYCRASWVQQLLAVGMPSLHSLLPRRLGIGWDANWRLRGHGTCGTNSLFVWQRQMHECKTRIDCTRVVLLVHGCASHAVDGGLHCASWLAVPASKMYNLLVRTDAAPGDRVLAACRLVLF